MKVNQIQKIVLKLIMRISFILRTSVIKIKFFSILNSNKTREGTILNLMNLMRIMCQKNLDKLFLIQQLQITTHQRIKTISSILRCYKRLNKPKKIHLKLLITDTLLIPSWHIEVILKTKPNLNQRLSRRCKLFKKKSII